MPEKQSRRPVGGSRPQMGQRSMNMRGPGGEQIEGAGPLKPKVYSPFGTSGPYAELRGGLLRVAQRLVQDEAGSLSGESLFSLSRAVYDFLRDASLGAAGAASTPGRLLGLAPGGPTSSPGKGQLTPAEKIRRRQERKYREALSRGLL